MLLSVSRSRWMLRLTFSGAGIDALTKKRDEGTLPDITGLRVITSGMKRCGETLALLGCDHTLARIERALPLAQ